MSLLRASHSWQSAGLVVHKRAFSSVRGLVWLALCHEWGMGRSLEYTRRGDWIHVVVMQEVR